MPNREENCAKSKRVEGGAGSCENSRRTVKPERGENIVLADSKDIPKRWLLFEK